MKTMKKTTIPETSSKVEQIAFKGLKTLIDDGPMSYVPKSQTTHLIKETLGASFTIYEVEAMLLQSEQESHSQAPYFDGRLLDKIELLKKALGKGAKDGKEETK